MPDQLLQECLDMAARESGGLLHRSIAVATKALAQGAASAGTGGDRGRLSDAADRLNKYGHGAVQAIPEIFKEEAGAASTASGARKAFSFDALELMAEDQVDDTVELVRGQQAVDMAVEQDVVQLNALVSALQGHELVQANTNPLRPEVWVKALHRSLGKCGVPTAVRALWMQHLCPAMGQELAVFYRKVSEHLLKQGVAAAAYKVSAPRHEALRRADAARITLRDLKRLVASASNTDGDTQGLSRNMTVPFAMEALKDMSRMDDVVKRMQDRWRDGKWDAEKTATEAAFTPTQTLAREVVRQMVENICADTRLLPQVHELVRTLEAPLLQLVLHDQRFFADRKHPARELLEEITQRSLAWPRPDTEGFAGFFGPLQEAAQLLAGMPMDDAEPFDFALQALRQSWAESEEKARRQRASVAKALIKADARNHAAAGVAAELRGRPDIASAPPEVRRFLLGPWSHVIAAAKLEAGEGAQDPGGHIALVNDIVWCSQPRLTGQNPDKHAKMAGPLLATIRKQLARIGAAGPEVEPFLATLAGTAPAPARAAPESEQVEWHADALPWLSPEEVQDSRLLQDADFSPTQVEEKAAGNIAALLKQLAVGDYVEVAMDGAWVRWKLSWASPHGTMLMFTDAGGKPQSTTARTLEKMIAGGAARLVGGGSVVESALDAVAQAALDNETQSPM